MEHHVVVPQKHHGAHCVALVDERVVVGGLGQADDGANQLRLVDGQHAMAKDQVVGLEDIRL